MASGQRAWGAGARNRSRTGDRAARRNRKDRTQPIPPGCSRSATLDKRRSEAARRENEKNKARRSGRGGIAEITASFPPTNRPAPVNDQGGAFVAPYSQSRMKHVFLGPRHLVQLTSHTDPDDANHKLFRVDALPRGAHRSTAFVHGEHLYRGPSAQEAWDAVLRFAPAAQAPAVLVGDLVAGKSAFPICPYCGTAVRPHHRQVTIPAHPDGSTADSRTAHAACAADEIRVDPRLASR